MHLGAAVVGVGLRGGRHEGTAHFLHQVMIRQAHLTEPVSVQYWYKEENISRIPSVAAKIRCCNYVSPMTVLRCKI